jgi:hypothetical protein
VVGGGGMAGEGKVTVPRGPRQPPVAWAFGRGRGRRCVMRGGGARPERSGRGPRPAARGAAEGRKEGGDLRGRERPGVGGGGGRG